MTENTMGRRAALKAAAAAGVATVVWAEPTIKGLARRPAYAATASGLFAFIGAVTITGTVNADGTISDIVALDLDGTPYIVESFPTTNDRPRLRLLFTGVANSLITFTNLTFVSGPTAPTGDIAASGRVITFLNPKVGGLTGPFELMVDVNCAA